MIEGLGIDIASVTRVRQAVQRRPALADRVFTRLEREDCTRDPQRWATRWAAKEAVRKLYSSCGRSMPAFQTIEVVRGDDGVPVLRVDGGRSELTLSLSHEGDLAVAVVAGTPGPARLALVPAEVCLAERADDAHKGTFGTLVVVGGSVGFSGAPLMTAMAAGRAGAGLVRLCVPEPIWGAAAAQTLEVMAHPFDAAEGGFALGALEQLRSSGLRGAAAVVIGPGIGRAPGTEALVLRLLEELPVPAVVDADALNIAAARGFDWRACPSPVMLTPHPAEMGRLAGVSTAEVQSARLDLATGFAARHGVVLVLKGSETVVAAPDGRTWVSSARAVALATGGSGDVLSGVAGAFLAQGLDPFAAACSAVFIHAQAGLAVQARLGRAGALARDLIEELPATQERVRSAIEERGRR